MRRRLYPLPVEGIIDHPDVLALPAAGLGILMRLVLHFWQTECRLLPVADHELRSIGRAHAPTWRHWKPVVLSVFDAIKPELEAYLALRQTKGTTIQMLGKRGASKAKLQALRAATALVPTFETAGLIVSPQRESRPAVPSNFVRSPGAGSTHPSSTRAAPRRLVERDVRR